MNFPENRSQSFKFPTNFRIVIDIQSYDPLPNTLECLISLDEQIKVMQFPYSHPIKIDIDAINSKTQIQAHFKFKDQNQICMTSYIKISETVYMKDEFQFQQDFLFYNSVKKEQNKVVQGKFIVTVFNKLIFQLNKNHEQIMTTTNTHTQKTSNSQMQIQNKRHIKSNSLHHSIPSGNHHESNGINDNNNIFRHQQFSRLQNNIKDILNEKKVIDQEEILKNNATYQQGKHSFLVKNQIEKMYKSAALQIDSSLQKPLDSLKQIEGYITPISKQYSFDNEEAIMQDYLQSNHQLISDKKTLTEKRDQIIQPKVYSQRIGSKQLSKTAVSTPQQKHNISLKKSQLYNSQQHQINSGNNYKYNYASSSVNKNIDSLKNGIHIGNNMDSSNSNKKISQKQNLQNDKSKSIQSTPKSSKKNISNLNLERVKSKNLKQEQYQLHQNKMYSQSARKEGEYRQQSAKDRIPENQVDLKQNGSQRSVELSSSNGKQKISNDIVQLEELVQQLLKENENLKQNQHQNKEIHFEEQTAKSGIFKQHRSQSMGKYPHQKTVAVSENNIGADMFSFQNSYRNPQQDPIYSVNNSIFLNHPAQEQNEHLLNIKIVNFENSLESLTEQIKKSERERDVYSEEIIRLKTMNFALAEKNRSQELNYQNLLRSQQLLELKNLNNPISFSKHTQLQSQLQMSNSEIVKLQSQIGEMEEQINSKDIVIEKFQGEITTLSQKLNHIQEKIRKDGEASKDNQFHFISLEKDIKNMEKLTEVNENLFKKLKASIDKNEILKNQVQSLCSLLYQHGIEYDKDILSDFSNFSPKRSYKDWSQSQHQSNSMQNLLQIPQKFNNNTSVNLNSPDGYNKNLSGLISTGIQNIQTDNSQIFMKSDIHSVSGNEGNSNYNNKNRNDKATEQEQEKGEDIHQFTSTFNSSSKQNSKLIYKITEEECQENEIPQQIKNNSYEDEENKNQMIYNNQNYLNNKQDFNNSESDELKTDDQEGQELQSKSQNYSRDLQQLIQLSPIQNTN